MPVDAFDAITRHSIYVEGVKDGAQDEIDETQKEVLAALLLLLSKLGIETLNQLTKVRLVKLLRELRKRQESSYKKYIAKITDFLRNFLAADFIVTRRMYEAIIVSTPTKLLYRPLFGAKAIDGTKDGIERLWAIVKATPVPASGSFIIDSIKDFASGAILAVERRIRMGVANAEKVSEVISAIKGTVANKLRDGLFAKQKRDHAAVVSTALQQTSQIVQAALASLNYKSYMWSSILDGRTTDICRSRANNIYVFGEGPLPPAHYRCRSKIVPLGEGESGKRVTFNEWLKQQPKEFQDDVLGKARANKFREGSLSPEETSNFSEFKPLTIEQFKSKTDKIIS